MDEINTTSPKEEACARLNVLGASLSVLKRNIRVFHWNVVGPEFIFVHEYLDQLQDDIAECIDAVYEELRKGDLPLHATLTECLSLSKIEEVSSADKYEAKEVFSRVLSDINIIRAIFPKRLSVTSSPVAKGDNPVTQTEDADKNKASI